MNIKEKISAYEKACYSLKAEFADRHDFSDDDSYWVAQEVGDVVCFNEDYFVSMTDIVTDLKNSKNKEDFFNWYEYDLRCHTLGINSVNYHSWLRGAPRRTEEELANIERLRQLAQEARETMKKAIDELNDKPY